MSIIRKALNMTFNPRKYMQEFWQKFPLGTFKLRSDFDAIPRPHYAYGVYNAALNAKLLGLNKVSCIEFGVAGGNGLICLEQLAIEVEKELGIDIEIYGFDLGSGLPTPIDYRDIPYMWQTGFYEMDEEKLRGKLCKSQLVIGHINDTVKSFFAEYAPAPIGFISFDFDFYSSTVDSFHIFKTKSENLLPRILCYFDDIIGLDLIMHNEYVGELLAIKEYNEVHAKKKITPIHGLRGKRMFPSSWNEQIYAHHDFIHPLYTKYIFPHDDRQMPLN